MATQLETQTETSLSLNTTRDTTHSTTEPPANTPKEKLQFGTLSKEIKELVVERVIRPSDLKNVCLVSKELHEIAVRYLYRNVSLDLGSPNDSRLSAFLSPKNIGLKHIKQLRLYLATVYDKCNQEQQAQFAARMILEFLPEDTLEEFRYARRSPLPLPDEEDELDSWCPWKPFSTDNLILLYKRQRKMKWLEVMDLDRDALPELKKNAKMQETMFKNARKLALYPENRETLNLSGFYVEKTKDQLEELIVHCNFPSDASDSRELNDSATAPGLVSNTIFSCMTPFDTCTPFQNLKSLRLHRISLRHCADTWCKFINFHEMQYLRIYHCTGADSLFGQLSKSSHLPKQLKVLEFQHRDNAENEALVALDGFLCLVSGLRDLVLDLDHVKALPAAAGIAKHGKTLELLNVHCTAEGHTNPITSTECDTDELIWDFEDFEKICKACKDLEQLSCAWPHTSLIRSPSDDWRSFENACGHLRNMVTLHISTWPSNKPSTQLLPRPVYETMLQALAQRGFELAAGQHSSSSTSPPPSIDEDDSESSTSESEQRPAKLRIIAFGTSDKIYEREDSKNQFIFVRSTCYDAEGRPKVYAAPVGWCLRQFVEPRSDVLDFVLHQSDRSNKPPCRDHRDTSAWGDEDE
ncbi:hypothetical protein PRZ48_010904 [Zasmidium cellare]|uniref:F-box domain-containing protein n=1 Tax=Zasmidium cellare TaxID=395010 RepID=A0ABR0E9Y5_ZASCE|nr:hypothetical protein PRZ48_010904 [Zasmidium cellare]